MKEEISEYYKEVVNGVIAQFGRASDLHSEGPEFESLWLHNKKCKIWEIGCKVNR